MHIGSINADCQLEQHLIEEQGEFLTDSIRNPIKAGILRPNGQSGIKGMQA